VSVVIRVLAGQCGFEKIVWVVVAEPVAAESTNLAQFSNGGDGCRHA
jgi:hypothetical protein